MNINYAHAEMCRGELMSATYLKCNKNKMMDGWICNKASLATYYNDEI